MGVGPSRTSGIGSSGTSDAGPSRTLGAGPSGASRHGFVDDGLVSQLCEEVEERAGLSAEAVRLAPFELIPGDLSSMTQEAEYCHNIASLHRAEIVAQEREPRSVRSRLSQLWSASGMPMSSHTKGGSGIGGRMLEGSGLDGLFFFSFLNFELYMMGDVIRHILDDKHTHFGFIN